MVDNDSRSHASYLDLSVVPQLHRHLFYGYVHMGMYQCSCVDCCGVVDSRRLFHIQRIQKMIGIDGNWKRDALEGGAYGLGFILINKLFPQFIIGVPHEVLFGLGGLTLTVCVVAPILEEIGFRGIVYPTLQKEAGENWAVLGASAAFSLFHWAAYGLALTTAFVGAFFFGLVSCIVAKKQNSLIGVVVMHSIFNWWMIDGSRLVFVG